MVSFVPHIVVMSHRDMDLQGETSMQADLSVCAGILSVLSMIAIVLYISWKELYIYRLDTAIAYDEESSYFGIYVKP